VFTEVPVLYGPLMTPVLSGGMVYEYSEETSDFGLVNINSNGSAQLLPDFGTLQTQFASLNVTALQGLPAKNTTVTPPTCSPSLIASNGTADSFNNNFTIPDVPPGAQALIDNGISPAPVGNLVTVTSTKVTLQVQQVDGTVIQGLAIIPLAEDQSNTPGSASSTVSSASAAATSKKSSATGVARNMGGLMGALMLIGALFSLM
jgi:hypothetical protein